MSVFSTLYPRRISVLKGIQNLIKREEVKINHLFLMVKIKKDDVVKTLVL